VALPIGAFFLVFVGDLASRFDPEASSGRQATEGSMHFAALLAYPYALSSIAFRRQNRQRCSKNFNGL